MTSDLNNFKKEVGQEKEMKAERNYLLWTKKYLYNENNSVLQELHIYIL